MRRPAVTLSARVDVYTQGQCARRGVGAGRQALTLESEFALSNTQRCREDGMGAEQV
jgi:hypothetical protein